MYCESVKKNNNAINKGMKKKIILIFDLDQTICKGSVTPEIMNLLLKKILQTKLKGGCIYIVTARRFSDFNNEQELLSHNIPEDIVHMLTFVNKYTYHRWIYYNNTISDIYNGVYELLQRRGLQEEFEQFVMGHSKRDFDILELNVGLIKMLQIEEILQKYSNLDEYTVYFFDDSKPNYMAYVFYSTYVNEMFNFINFVGGENKAVFQNPDHVQLLYSII
jgi:hypothetical protein